MEILLPLSNPQVMETEIRYNSRRTKNKFDVEFRIIHPLFSDPIVSIRKIAKENNIAPKYMEHVYNRYFAPLGLSGVVSARKRRKLRYQAMAEKFVLNTPAWRFAQIAIHQGMNVETVPYSRGRVSAFKLKVNGLVCVPRFVSTKSRKQPGQERLYFNVVIPTNQIINVDVVSIVVCDEERTLVYNIPRTKLFEGRSTEKQYTRCSIPEFPFAPRQFKSKPIFDWRMYQNWRVFSRRPRH